MIKAEQGGSMYDFMQGDYEAPQVPEAECKFANREDMSKPYVNREAPKVNSVEIEQKDESSIAYWRLFTQQIPKGEFEQSVNIRFGGREAIGGSLREQKIEYIKLYKQMLGEL